MRSHSLGNGGFISTVGRHVDVCPVFCAPFTLSAALGRMQETAKTLTASNAVELSTPPMRGVACEVAAAVSVCWEVACARVCVLGG